MTKSIYLFGLVIQICLMSSCAEPVDSQPTHIPSIFDDLEARISRIENGLAEINDEGQVNWEEKHALTERMERYGVPGISIAVINDYQVEWAKGYGVLEAGGSERVTPNSLFHAGSIAKLLSAAVALALVEDGRLGLDQDVNAWLVSWQVPENPYTVEEKVTLRRLLSHSAGLTDGFPMRSSSDPEFDWWGAEGQVPAVTIQQLLEAQPPTEGGVPTRVTRTPGSDYHYSNFGYGVVQLLLTDVSQQSFAALMREELLVPLEMKSSTFEQPLPEELRDRATSEHDVDGRPFPGRRHHYPIQAAGGLWTTPSDLAAFAIEIMRANAGESDLVLSEQMAGEMLTAQIQIEDAPLVDSSGLGFELSGEGQGMFFMHTGGTWGSTSLLWVYPETGQGAIIMTNSAAAQGVIRFEVLLSIAAEYEWPLVSASG